jgi:hypothetical protein
VVLGQLVTERSGPENGTVLIPVILKLTTEVGGQILQPYGWFSDLRPSAPQRCQRWEHCRWLVTQMTIGIAPSTSLGLQCC